MKPKFGELLFEHNDVRLVVGVSTSEMSYMLYELRDGKVDMTIVITHPFVSSFHPNKVIHLHDAVKNEVNE